MIETAKSMETQMKRMKEEAKRCEEARNHFQTEIKRVREKINDETIAVDENMYRMNELTLLTIIDEFNMKYGEKENGTVERMNLLIEEFKQRVEDSMKQFCQEYKEQQRREKEEQKRRRTEELARRQREEEERMRREYEKKLRNIALWKELFINSFLLTSYISETERSFLKNQYTL